MAELLVFAKIKEFGTLRSAPVGSIDVNLRHPSTHDDGGWTHWKVAEFDMDAAVLRLRKEEEARQEDLVWSLLRFQDAGVLSRTQMLAMVSPA